MRIKGLTSSAAVFAHEAAQVIEHPSVEAADGLLTEYWSYVYRAIWNNRHEGAPPPFQNLTNDHESSLAQQSHSLVNTDAYSVLDGSDFRFKEIMTVYKNAQCKIHTCHFSSDGKFLAYAGSDRMISVWDVESSRPLPSTRELSGIITDVRFKPQSTSFAAASCNDSIIRIWDVKNVNRPTKEFKGHIRTVASVDFCPDEPNMLCSCDTQGEICFWDFSTCLMISKFKVDGVRSKLVRFGSENIVAMVLGNKILMCSVNRENNVMNITPEKYLEGHVEDINSVCWDYNRGRVASVSHDRARVWSTSNTEWTCDYEYISDGHKYESCVFHPVLPQLLIIGAYQHIVFWDFLRGDKTRAIQSRCSGFVSSFTCNRESRLIASSSRDSQVKLWEI